MRMIAMCYRNARPGRSGNRARYTGNNLKWNAGFNQGARFLRTSSKNERVAAFQPAHGLAFTSFLDHEPLDAFLLDVFVSRFFADVNNLGIVASFVEQSSIDQSIVQHDVGFTQARQPPHGDQVRISRPRADDEYSARMLHRAFS